MPPAKSRLGSRFRGNDEKEGRGNPTQSYRSRAPLRIVGEVESWEPHSPERLQAMKDHLARMSAEGGPGIID